MRSVFCWSAALFLHPVKIKQQRIRKRKRRFRMRFAEKCDLAKKCDIYRKIILKIDANGYRKIISSFISLLLNSMSAPVLLRTFHFSVTFVLPHQPIFPCVKWPEKDRHEFFG